MDKKIWLVGIRKNNETFYCVDYNDDDNSVSWSKIKENGITFNSERTINMFIARHLPTRTEIFLIHTNV